MNDGNKVVQMGTRRGHRSLGDFFTGMCAERREIFESLLQYVTDRGIPASTSTDERRHLQVPILFFCPALKPYTVTDKETDPMGILPDTSIMQLFPEEEASGKGHTKITLLGRFPYSLTDNIEDLRDLYADLGTMGLEYMTFDDEGDDLNVENEFLKVVFRISFPLFDPKPSYELLDRLFAIAGTNIQRAVTYMEERLRDEERAEP